ncbi:hypothetical protein EDD86DRAFT_197318 [Gorgonomyces haynaldii]|nr:hypothetical protein EDD86DRAFT_197318 [Gorgonomyces haynaldii]
MLNDFMKAIIAAENQYAQALLRAAKPIKDDFARKQNEKNAFHKTVFDGTNYQALQFCVSEVEGIAGLHTELATLMEDEIRKNFKAKRKALEQFNAKKYEDIEKARYDLRRSLENLEKHEKHEDRTMRDLEQATAQLEAARDPNKKANIERAKAEFDKKTEMAHQASAERVLALKECNDLKNQHFHQTLPALLYSIQKEDESNRIENVRATLQQMLEAFKNRNTKMEPILTRVLATVSAIKGNQDTAMFASRMSSKELPPEDLDLKDTVSLDNQKRSIIRGGEKIADTDEEKEITTLGYKKGRKRAVDRIRSLDREIEETQKQESGFEALLEVSKSKNAQTEHLDQTKESLNQRKMSLMMKKYQMEVFIAQCDGTPMPEAPKFTSLPSKLKSGSQDSQPKESITGKPISESPIVNGTQWTPTQLRMCRVLYDFEAAPQTKEMSVKQDETIYVVQKGTDGWWKCRKLDQSDEGYVPETYVEMC